MKRLRVVLTAAAMLMCATASQAYINYLDPSSAFNSPTTTECVAYGSAMQTCKKCQRNYDQYGNEIGWGCAPQFENASCGCSFKYSCGETGTCTYK